MLAIELSTSNDCAREIRGTASIDNAVIGRSASVSTMSGVNRGASSAINVAPGFIWSSSDLGRGVDREHDVGPPGVADGRARVDEGLVREVGPVTRPRRDHDLVAQLQQLGHGRRRRGDARLTGLGLPHHTDDHFSTPLATVGLRPA